MPRQAIVLVDGEHHPAAVREALDRLDAERGVAAVVFCGGEEKLGPGSLEEHYGRPTRTDPEAALRELAGAAEAVVDLADEPVLPAGAKLRLAALALHLGLSFETPGGRLEPPRYEPVSFAGPKVAVIATGKRTGKTAVAGHWAKLIADWNPVIVCMGRGGPAEPQVARADTALDDLLAVVEGGGHGASDFLEDAVLAGVPTVGCRRVGGGLAGAPAESNVPAGAELAASLDPGAIIFEGSGACIPPVEVDRTLCIVGAGSAEPFAEYRVLRADLVLAAGDGGPEGVAALRAAGGARGARAGGRPRRAVHHRRSGGGRGGAGRCFHEPGPPLGSGRRLEKAAAEGCDLYLTELKAAAIDTVALQARERGARIVFVRNRPVGIDQDLDEALMSLIADA